jgi:hypothetical protein
MPFVQIPQVYAADPGDLWTPKNSFAPSDAFAIVLIVQISSDVLQSGLRYDTVWQIANPRLDPLGDAWWYWDGGAVLDRPTIDRAVSNLPFSFTHFARWCSWSSWAYALYQTQPKLGVFFVRGTVNVLSSSLFARSGEFWFKVGT